MNEWISVKDRLPDDNAMYLCYCIIPKKHPYLTIDKSYEIYYFTSVGDSHFKVTFDGEEVTHWMPLPEPPEIIKS